VFFHSWGDIGRAVVTTAIVFLLIVALLRVIGPRAIARMSGYDMVATVTLGSVVATVAVTRGVTVSEGLAALLTLVGLQEVVRLAQSRWLAAHHVVRQPPIVVVWNGELLEDRLRGNNISADEVRAAIRGAGLASVSEARVVVLENDGNWSVISMSAPIRDASALYGLPIPGTPEKGSARDDGATGVPASPRRLP
jgi:uncharacterized membrane protein YcaP (DUF421 family)